MRPSFKSLSILLAALSSVIAEASEVHMSCNTPNADAVLQMERDFAAKRAASGIQARDTKAPIAATIDVYFHVINKGDSPKDGNVPDIQLTAQINVLNTDFFNTNLTFRLADTTRTKNSTWYQISDALDLDNSAIEMKKQLRKGGSSDLNVYLVGKIDTAYGYSTFPYKYTENPALDGVVIRSSTVPGGSDKAHNLGHILTHEVGHWVGLYHLFDNGCNGDDFVDDTPQQANVTKQCPSELDSCPGNQGMDLIHNFMGLSDCMYDFTPGQISRLREQISTYRGIPFAMFNRHTGFGIGFGQ